LVDGDGYTKAQSKALEKNTALDIFKKIRTSGIEEYSGDKVSIWTESYPTVQNKTS
ncbi:MAG: hypothetical protein HYS75_04610, partial [Nitrosopumilales archaeon]|nr:hypothetical protein [Nitrosopumilales archaeon]